MSHDEPTIVINGTTLSPAQAMAVRVAVTMFRAEVAMREESSELDELYKARLSEVEELLLR